MKILINSINYSPELVGIGKYTSEMATWLAARGNDVRVVTAPPYYPDWRVFDGYSSYAYRRKYIEGVEVTRCPLWVPGEPGGLKRVLHLLSFAVTSFPVMLWRSLWWRPDLILVIEPPLACAPGVLVCSLVGGARSWLHIQDFEVDAAFDLDLLKSHIIRKAVTSLEAWLMRRFTRVSTISQRMLDRLIEKSARDDCVLFENWVELDNVYPMAESVGLRYELGLPAEGKIVLYSGNMGNKQGLEIIVDAASRLRDRDDAIFLMCGNGSARRKLEKSASHLRNMKFIPLQPRERLNELLNLASIHLLPQKAGAEDLVMPSKLSNMMASGRPVVATALPGSQIYKVLEGRGLCVEPGEGRGFADAIASLLDDEKGSAGMGEASREYVVENWDIDKVLGRAFGGLSGRNVIES